MRTVSRFDRQHDVHVSSLTWFAHVGPDLATVGFDDTARDREPEPGSGAGAVRTNIRLEDHVRELRGEPATIVDDVEVQTALVDARTNGHGHRTIVRRVTERAALDALMMLGAHPDATPDVRAVVLHEIRKLGQGIGARKDSDPLGEAHLRQAEADITRYLENPSANAPKFVAPGWGTRPRSRYPLSPGPPLGGGGN